MKNGISQRFRAIRASILQQRNRHAGDLFVLIVVFLVISHFKQQCEGDSWKEGCSPNSQQEQRSTSPQGTSLGLYTGKLTVYAANICWTEAALTNNNAACIQTMGPSYRWTHLIWEACGAKLLFLMEAKTELPDAKFCLEETVQESKQRRAFYCWTKPSEEDGQNDQGTVFLQLRSFRDGRSTLQGKNRPSTSPAHVCKITEYLVEDKEIQV